MFKKINRKLVITAMNIIIAVALIAEAISAVITLNDNHKFKRALLAQPEIIIRRENMKVEFDWYEGVYVTNYSFNVIQDGKYKSCELEVMLDKTYAFQDELRIKMYDGKVYTKDGGMILCQPT